MTVATTGSPQDPDGYTITVDQGNPQPIGTNGAISLTALAVGQHRLELSGTSADCTVAGENPRSVTVVAGEVVESGFTISCSVALGSLTVTTSTDGPGPDPDGYTFRVDQAPEQAIGVNASVTITDLEPGTRTVELGGVAANCEVEGDNPQTVELAVGTPATVAFSVACATGVERWSRMASGTNADLPDVWGSSGSDVFVVGELPVDDDLVVASVILRYDGTRWRRDLRQTDLVLRAVWGTGASNVFAVGLDFNSNDAKLLRYDGTSWSDVPGFTSEFEQLALQSVWGSAENDVFAVGGAFDGDFDRSLIYHFDGSSWQRMPQPVPVAPALVDVWGSAANDVYAVGRDDEVDPANGVVLHYDGARWSPVVEEPGLSLNSIWGSSASDVFAAGFRVEEVGDEFRVIGTIVHFDGTSWSPMSLPSVGLLSGVWGSSATDVFAVGDQGAVLHYDGTRWSRMNAPRDDLLGVWGSSPTDVFAVGSGGAILHGTP